jgi:hypothetical protein
MHTAGEISFQNLRQNFKTKIKLTQPVMGLLKGVLTMRIRGQLQSSFWGAGGGGGGGGGELTVALFGNILLDGLRVFTFVQ